MFHNTWEEKNTKEKLIKPTKINLCQQAQVQNQVVYPYIQYIERKA
jgi:hypothetical protein